MEKFIVEYYDSRGLGIQEAVFVGNSKEDVVDMIKVEYEDSLQARTDWIDAVVAFENSPNFYTMESDDTSPEKRRMEEAKENIRIRHSKLRGEYSVSSFVGHVEISQVRTLEEYINSLPKYQRN